MFKWYKRWRRRAIVISMIKKRITSQMTIWITKVKRTNFRVQGRIMLWTRCLIYLPMSKYLMLWSCCTFFITGILLYKLSRVGHLKIVDLSSEVAVQILKSKISVEAFDQIISATNMESITLSEYAFQLLSALERSPLSFPVLRETLYEYGFKKDFDFIRHSDAGFVEVAIRHL